MAWLRYSHVLGSPASTPSRWWALKPVILSLVLLAQAAAGQSGQALSIDVVGLFTDTAIVNINGQQVMLRVGAEPVQGVTLLAADSRGARIEVDGKVLTLDLSSRISANFEAVASPTVAINRVDDHYRTVGSINGRPVSFMVDTGATMVAMSSVHAADLRLDLKNATAHNVSTAGGVVAGWELTVERVDVGDIRVNNVPVLVLPGDFPVEILLGMSFLRHVDIQENAGLLLLRGR